MKSTLILVASSGKNIDLAYVIKDLADKAGFTSELVNLVDLKLPLYSTSEEESAIPEAALTLAKKCIEADSLIFIAPEYNGSVPPVFNNTIAWISRSGDRWRDAFNGKPALIATHSGGGGAHVLMAMRQQLAFIGANVLGRQLLTNFGKEYSIESIESCLEQLG